VSRHRQNARLGLNWRRPGSCRRYKRDWMRAKRKDQEYRNRELDQQAEYRRRERQVRHALRQPDTTTRLLVCAWCRQRRAQFVARQVQLPGPGTVWALVPWCGRC